jgi:hypothetical protein
LFSPLVTQVDKREYAAIQQTVAGFDEEFVSTLKKSENTDKPKSRCSFNVPDLSCVQALQTGLRFGTDERTDEEERVQGVHTITHGELLTLMRALVNTDNFGDFDPVVLTTNALTASMSGLKQGITYCGVENFGMGSIRFQWSGSRLLAIARPDDIGSFLGEDGNSIKSVIKFMQETTPDSLNAMPGSVSSFKVAQIYPGDVMVLPMGMVFAEHAINANSVTVKVPLTVLTDDSYADFMWINLRIARLGGPGAGPFFK